MDDPDPAAALTTIIGALTTTTARHPEIGCLLVTEGIRGGPRLRQILTRMTPLRAALDSLAGPVDPDTLFLTLLLLTAAPFALAELTREITGRDPLTPACPTFT